MGVLVEIMDCMFGRPAAGVPVQLLREAEPTWQEVVSARTGETGCVAPYGSGLQRGRYRLVSRWTSTSSGSAWSRSSPGWT